MIKKILIMLLGVFMMTGDADAIVAAQEYKTAVFAGGCFWCVESDMDKLEGVIATKSGYSGGVTKNPEYKQVSSGVTGHYEVVEITYNPNVISFEDLTKYFMRTIDIFDGKGQFCDKGQQYASAVFYKSEEEKLIVESVFADLQENFKAKIETEILEEKIFYDAEDYHQDYYKKNPVRYKYYRYSCGRDNRVKEIFKDVPE